MKVGVFSDTHDRLEMLDWAVGVFKERGVERLVHCGDWVSPFALEYFDEISKNADFQVPVYSVFGNNEGDIKRILERSSKLTNPIEWAPKLVFELRFGEREVAVFHGHDKPTLKALIDSGNYDAVMSGHTHMPVNEYKNETLILNPGSTSFARLSKRIHEASVAVYDAQENSAELIMYNRPNE